MTLSRNFGIGALGALALGLALTTAACSSSDDNKGTGGSSGSTGGSSGSTGGSSGSTGGMSGSTGGMGGGGAVTPAFTDVAPCSAEGDYMKVTTITATQLLKYSPACVQVKKGTAVKFMMNFASHPLKPSAMRGDAANNPIKETTTGMEASFTFDKTGFFGFFCTIHGASDNGSNMAGVVWVTD